jgi:hypothetical protein
MFSGNFAQPLNRWKMKDFKAPLDPVGKVVSYQGQGDK